MNFSFPQPKLSDSLKYVAVIKEKNKWAIKVNSEFRNSETAQEAKNKKIRRIPINRSLLELLLKLNLTRNGNRYIFINIL